MPWENCRAVPSQQLPHVCFERVPDTRPFGRSVPGGYAMQMRPYKAETAVHGCSCPGDMAVRMHKVLARPWVGVRVCHLL